MVNMWAATVPNFDIDKLISNNSIFSNDFQFDTFDFNAPFDDLRSMSCMQDTGLFVKNEDQRYLHSIGELARVRQQLIENEQRYLQSMAEYARMIRPDYGLPLSPVLSNPSPRMVSAPIQEQEPTKTEFSPMPVQRVEKKLSPSEKKKLREYARNLTCFNCHTNRTPLWRRTADKKHNLCNACGLYYKQYLTHRPLSYKERTPRVKRSASHDLETLQ